MSPNLAASIRARLKNHADAAKEDFNLTLTRYGLERLLYRLSVSPAAPGRHWRALHPVQPGCAI
jgi:hypothetical protein